MTPALPAPEHEQFMSDQSQMKWSLSGMLRYWHEWPKTPVGRLVCDDKRDLRRLGEGLMRLGNELVAEAERQKAEHESEKVA